MQIKQDTEKVHLLGEDGKTLCGVDHGVRPYATVALLADWLGGYVPATVGARMCGACEEKAGTAAKFEPGERDEARVQGFRPLDQA